MKKIMSQLIAGAALVCTMNSCYINTFAVGEGAKTAVEKRQVNHYLIYGLVPLKVANPQEMADGAENYEVTIKHSFVDGLINSLTLGIYTPTTTIVRQ